MNAMKPSDPIIPASRLTYRDGQRLTARDLRDDQLRHLRLGWLHDRYLHGWGIVLGFEVSPSYGGNTVIVTPGYALDSLGRGLLLAENFPLPVPPAEPSATYLLTISFPEIGPSARADLANRCPGAPHSHPPLLGFSWRQPEEARLGPEVPLVRLNFVPTAAKVDLDFQVRRHVRPLVRPHMGWGATEPGQTGWSAWEVAGKVVGVEVRIDTSEAGFLFDTPYYFAWLQLTTPTAGPGDNVAASHLGFIAEAARDFFIYRISTLDLKPQALEAHGYTVFWLGLEPFKSCVSTDLALKHYQIFSAAAGGTAPPAIIRPVRKRCKDG